MANTSHKEKILIGAGVAALAAGVYFFKSDAGKKHAKKMRGWMVRMKGEVLERIEEAGEVTEPVYREIVDTVANAQMVAAKVPRSEILQLATDLKRQWNTIKRLAGGSKSSAKKKAGARGRTKSKSAKKAAKRK